jgi:hypothetical protein
LSQLFIELNRSDISRHSVHLQLYTYSDIIGQAVRKSLGPLKMFAGSLEERLIVVQGYLHSDESPTIAMRRLGGLVVPPLLQLAEPGRGFHCGGSLPMRPRPGKFESDLLGRPQGWTNVHAVDASVLPAVPATTITFTVMANAHRIGWETAAG